MFSKFSYNEENFSFNINDVFLDESFPPYNIIYINGRDSDRIIYNEEMNYFLVYDNNLAGSTSLISSSHPDELIPFHTYVPLE